MYAAFPIGAPQYRQYLSPSIYVSLQFAQTFRLFSLLKILILVNSFHSFLMIINGIKIIPYSCSAVKQKVLIGQQKGPGMSFLSHFPAMVGEVGFEPTQPCGNGFTVRPN